MTKTRRIRRSKRRKMGAGRIRRTRRAIRTKESEEAEKPKNRGAERTRKVIYFEDFKKLAKLEKGKNSEN